MEQKIRLNTVDKVFAFSDKIVSFDEDVDIKTIDCPTNTFDAKSLISLFCLDLSKELIISINATDGKSIEKFKALAEEYK